MTTATAQSSPNIAFIKYWGNRNETLRLPSNGSISMNLDRLITRTTVRLDPAAPADRLLIGGTAIGGGGLARVQAFLTHVRNLAGSVVFAEVSSANNFPTGAGVASSASAFAALALAAAAAYSLPLDEAGLSRLARRGSGSACRSVPGGFVEWLAGENDETSYAVSLAPAEHWPLVDHVAIVSTAHKATGSTEGHSLAATSPLQAARVADAPRRLKLCREAILQKDFAALAEVAEQDSNLMHAVMMTSTPSLFYWQPASLAILRAAPGWRSAGLPCFYTVDAGANVHVIAPAEASPAVRARLAEIPGVQKVLTAAAGGPAHLG